jgi:hypothetical protein
MRLFGWVGRRLSTSLMYAQGSCPFIRADWIKLITAAARLPARRLPANSQLRISAIVDACFRLIVDGNLMLPWRRWGSAQELV